MANNQVFADIESLREVWTFEAETEAGVAVMNGSRAGVTYIGTPGITRTQVFGTLTITGIPVPNNGQAPLTATVSTTGTWEFPVAGATAATEQGTKVYFVTADGSLTLTDAADGSTPYFGIVNLPEGYIVRGTTLPIKIGVVA